VTAFADRGYAASSLDRIAAETGIRKSSLLHRFGSKEVLYLEALTHVLGNLGELVQSAASGTEDFVGRLDRLSRLITDYLGDEPRAARLLFREAMDRGPFFSGPGGPLFLHVLRTAVSFIEEGVEAGAFSSSDPKDTVMSIVGLHLSYFAIHELSEQVLGAPVFEVQARDRRRVEVVAQVRRICGVS
tara:strand:+ start:307 stop:867 length:561 start_codon:yes stop_codon:yes gene_type:complete